MNRPILIHIPAVQINVYTEIKRKRNKFCFFFLFLITRMSVRLNRTVRTRVVKLISNEGKIVRFHMKKKKKKRLKNSIVKRRRNNK